MKSLYTFLKISLIQSFLFLSFFSYSQCSITGVTATVTACEGEFFDVLISFDHQNTSDQFTINGNGISYGIFAYADLPITLTSLSANCETPYEFVVKDLENNECSDFVELGPVCCEDDCILSELVLSVSECDGGFFSLTIDFDYSGTTHDFFNWEVIGLASGVTEFEDLPLTITLVNLDTYIFEVLINESDNESCFVSGTFENPCYDENECGIVNVTAEIVACEGELFDASINFVYANTSDQFTINGNGNSYGTFAYDDLPILLTGLNANCESIYEFVIHDVNNNDCSAFGQTGPVCCEEDCEINNLVITTTDCIDGSFEVTFNFDYSGTTNDFFDWEFPGTGVSGFDLFSDLPLTVELNNVNNAYFGLFVGENDNPDCSTSMEAMNPCFEGQCMINDLSAEVTACEGELFDIQINFNYANTSDHFTIHGNGVTYGTFSYADVPVTLTGLSANCETSYEFVVTDVNNNDCSDFVDVGPVCCEGPCDFSNLVIETTECNDGHFEVTFDFDYTGTTNNFFDWEISGIASGFTGFADLPYTVVIENTTNIEFNLYINENDNPECNIQGEFQNPCYNSESCFIGELNVDVSDCNDNNQFFVVINFEHSNTSENFTVSGNGNSYGTYAYANLPITIDGFEADCDFNFEFVVHDVEYDDCSSSIAIGPVCCEEGCEISDLSIETSECMNGTFTITINFDYTGTTNNFFNWEIPGIGASGTALFADLPLTIELENFDAAVFTLVVGENDNPDCNTSAEAENPCFEGGECNINELTAEVVACEGEHFDIQINFNYSNTSDHFTVNGNGTSYGSFAYADLPITLTGLAADCETNYEFVVHDENNNDCGAELNFGEVCCEDGCILDDLVIETSECDGGVFTVQINFNYSGTTNPTFDYEIPGITSGTSAFGDLPLNITIENHTQQGFAIFINENDNPDCSISGEFANPCFNPEGCSITELYAEVVACEGGLFDILINFDYSNTSEHFTIVGNGVEYGSFSYNDLPVTLTGLAADCETEYEFIVSDVVHNDCGAVLEFGDVCCEGECDLSELDLAVGECDFDGFVVTVDFNYQGTTNQYFDWEIPGVGGGLVAFVDLPLTIVIENVTTQQFTFFANENDNPDCAIVGSFANPCFDPDACIISALTAIVVACEEEVFDVEIDFNHNNTSNSFTIVGNGISYGIFDYADLPITLTGLAANCDTEYEFIIQDLEENECAAEVVIGQICCDDFNLIGQIQVDAIIDGEIYTLKLNIENTTLKGCSIDVYVNGTLFITLASDESILTLGPFECGSDDEIDIRLVNTCSLDIVEFTINLVDFECTTGIEEEFDTIDLRWNMPQRILFIEGEIYNPVNLQILNVHGELIYSNQNLQSGWNLSMIDYPAGLYFVRIVDANNAKGEYGFIKKIVVF